jgi:AcrR family transcriptional regulator
VARKRSLDEGPVLRAQIVERASLLFYERGYGATSIRDIAKAVSISSSTMYHHFTNKQDVLHAIVSRFMTDFVDATLPVLHDRSLSPTERIRRTVALHIEISDDRRPELLVGNPIRYALDPDRSTLTARPRASSCRPSITTPCGTRSPKAVEPGSSSSGTSPSRPWRCSTCSTASASGSPPRDRSLGWRSSTATSISS